MISRKWFVPIGGALLVASLNAHAFEVSPQARLHLDYAKHSEDRKELEDGTMVRRARFGIKGQHEDWSFKIDYEFSGDGELKSGYVTYEGWELAEVSVGQFTVPFGLEQETSSNSITFIERSLPVEAFEPNTGAGVGLEHVGAKHTLVAMAYGPDFEGDGYNGIGARVTYAPLLEKDSRLLHFGASLGTEEIDDSLKLRVRPEARPADVRLVNTGGIDDVHRIHRVGLETAWQNGPLSAQAEWLRADLKRDSGESSLDFDGWYLSGSWVITGEARPYRSGVFKGIKPVGPYGAWELAARYSHINLNDLDIEGGKEQNLSLGVNWYVNNDLRVMLNYINVDSDRRGKSDDPDILLMRAQLVF